jgi:hypothetical protein
MRSRFWLEGLKERDLSKDMGRRWEDNIKMDLTEMVLEDVD